MSKAMERGSVKLKIANIKYRGVIIDQSVDVGMVETTRGGSLGGPPDPYRTFVPGMRTTTLRVRVKGALPLRVPNRVQVKVKGAKCQGELVGLTWFDESLTDSWTVLTIEVMG